MDVNWSPMDYSGMSNVLSLAISIIWDIYIPCARVIVDLSNILMDFWMLQFLMHGLEERFAYPSRLNTAF